MDLFNLVARLTLDTSEYEAGLTSAEQKAKNDADKMEKSITTFATAGAAALGAFAVSSVKTGAQFDSSMAQVAATMGVTVDEIQDLRVFAQEMGATTAFSASQAADALNYMALAGYDADKSMEMLPTVLNLAAAGGIDLASASDMVTDAASALGLTTEETAQMVDKMAQASSKSNTSVAQLGEAILTVGGTAKNLTGGTTELATALGIMADSGIKGAEGGTHLRNILLALNPTTKEAIEAFEDLGINAYDAEGNLRPLNDTFSELAVKLQDYTAQEKQDLLSNIFNKTDLAAIDALLTAATYDMDGLKEAVGALGINWGNLSIITDQWEMSAEEGMEEIIRTTENWILSGSTMEQTLKLLCNSFGMTQEDAVALFETVSAELDNQGNRWTELTGYIDDATDAAEKMANTQLDNLEGDITLLKSAFEGLQIKISDGLTPAFRDAIQFLIKIIDNFDKLAPIIAGVTVAISAFALAINIGNIIKSVTTAMAAFNAVLAANPIGIVIAVIAGLTAAIVTLWKTNEEFREIVLGVWDAIKDAAGSLLDAIVNIFGSIGEAILSVWDFVKDATQSVFDFIDEIFYNIHFSAMELMSSIESIIINAQETVISIFENIGDSIFGILEDARNWGHDLIQNFIDGIMDKWYALRDAVSNVAQTVKDFIGFSEPKKGPLSNFHTYAPDMIDLFAEGLKDSQGKLQTQFDQSFAMPSNSFGNSYVGGAVTVNVYGAQGQDVNSLADAVMRKITHQTEQDRRAFAWSGGY